MKSSQRGGTDKTKQIDLSINPKDFVSPVVFILIGSDNPAKMNLFISSALYSESFYISHMSTATKSNSAIENNNVIFINDQDFAIQDKHKFGETLNRTNDKYNGKGWPKERTFYCNKKHWKNTENDDKSDPCLSYGIKSVIQDIIKQNQILAARDEKILPIVFEFHGHGGEDGSISFTTDDHELNTPLKWTQFFEEIVEMQLSQKYFPILFLSKQCYGATFSQKLRDNLSKSSIARNSVQLITISGDTMACPRTVLGSQTTIFLHAWMSNLKKLHPHKNFDVEYLIDDKNPHEFAHALVSKKIIDNSHTIKADNGAKPYPVQCRAEYANKKFVQLPLSVFNLVDRN